MFISSRVKKEFDDLKTARSYSKWLSDNAEKLDVEISKNCISYEKSQHFVYWNMKCTDEEKKEILQIQRKTPSIDETEEERKLAKEIFKNRYEKFKAKEN